ncbi:TIGR04283 family arsenosugar biosynthesis glycosyltransferase [Halopseudomonas sp.]|uniref:TIGR04283 family arsenosugar biosynthesis glycosyltransferase n=1 Tax=Halopseudomonas sp. TaxID=2901191 RepID=UPI0030014995
MHWLSVVIPVRNEAEGIAQVLGPLQALRDQLEIIVVDGGSDDDTATLAAPLADKVLASPPGRARQMNAGAAAATGEVLLFLHADTQLPEGFVGMIRAVIPAPPTVSPAPPYVIPAPPYVIPAQAGIQTDVQQTKEPNRKHSAHPHPTMDPRVREDDVEVGTVIPAQAGIQANGQQAQEPNRDHSAHPHPTMDPRVREDDVGVGTVIPAHAGIHFDLGVQYLWGRFDVRLAPSSPTLRLVAWMMNQRSRLTGICTGDQALFVRRDLFNQLGGYADIPLMEDIELSKRLKRISQPACIRQPLTTSSRRWQTRGVLRTIVLMWWLRLQYWAGVSPAKLVKKYYPARPSSE